MTLIKSIRPSAQSNDIIHFLQIHPFVKQATRLKDNHFVITLSVSEAATEVFVQLLEAASNLIVNFVPRTRQKDASISIRTTDADSIQLINDLTHAFNKTSQYLELKKEYASGYVPTHLSQWLVEGNLLGQ